VVRLAAQGSMVLRTVDCGAGTNDHATVDHADAVKGCEHVTRK
jgi:hypothetical protein